jgi:hypothetical protein
MANQNDEQSENAHPERPLVGCDTAHPEGFECGDTAPRALATTDVAEPRDSRRRRSTPQRTRTTLPDGDL